MLTTLLFIIILSILVFVHEFGHFIVARLSGMRVHEFGLGFPPMAIGFYRDPITKKWIRVRRKKRDLVAAGMSKEFEDEYPATVYSLNWLPIGGFCKIKGENGEKAAEPDSFGGKPAYLRLLVLVAGVGMNIVLAGALLVIGLSVGIPTDLSNGTPPGAVLVDGRSIVIESVVKNSPAEKAGLQFGDKVISLNNVEVVSAATVIEYVADHKTETINMKLRRGDKDMSVSVKPEILQGIGDVPKLGIQLIDAGLIRYPWYSAIPRGFWAAIVGVINTILAFFILLKGLIFGQGLAFDVSGPVGIASLVGRSAELGANYLLHITAMISVSLAAMNILPIPALDGGRVLFVLIEKVFRRPVPMRYEQLAHTIGFVLLILLIVIVTGKDILGLVR